MRNFLFALLWCFFSWGMSAQVPPQEENAVTRFAVKVENSRLAVDYSFVLHDKTRMTGKGAIVIQSDAFKLNEHGLEIYCDGQSRWIVDKEAKEVAIEPGMLDAGPANPVSLLTEINTLFTIGEMQEGVFRNKPAHYSILAARQAGDIHLMKLYFQGEHPVGMIVTLSDDRIIEIAFNSVIFTEKGDKSDFEFKTDGLDSSWIVNDLR